MRLLVLGGTHHVGRAVVEAAVARGDAVTTLTRGLTGHQVPGVDARHADRRDVEEMTRVLGSDTWDAVVDTWSFEPRAVRDAVRVLDGFGGAVLIARAGLVLGPYEVVGRLPWWLGRIAAGGLVPAPGPTSRPLQYIDARDLAAWVLEAGSSGLGGVFNTVSRPGHTTIGDLLGACVSVTGSAAELVWVGPDAIAAAGVEGWTDLPIWVPPTGELAALHDADVTAAHTAGLHCRPMEETVADTWAWLQREGTPDRPNDRAGDLGLSEDQERQLLGR